MRKKKRQQQQKNNNKQAKKYIKMERKKYLLGTGLRRIIHISFTVPASITRLTWGTRWSAVRV